MKMHTLTIHFVVGGLCADGLVIYQLSVHHHLILLTASA